MSHARVACSAACQLAQPPIVPPARLVVADSSILLLSGRACWPRCSWWGLCCAACSPLTVAHVCTALLRLQGMLATLQLVRRQDLLAYTVMALRGQKDVLELEVRCAVLCLLCWAALLML